MRIILLTLALLVAGCPLSGEVIVEMETSEGAVTLKLYPDQSPKAVRNFVEYANAGHYAGTVFHRVIPGFVVQGGGYRTDFSEKATRAPVANESSNGVSNARGTIAMARTPDPDSARAQFYFNLADNAQLDDRPGPPRRPGYTVFGEVVEGFVTLERISRLPTGRGGPFARDVPQRPVVINAVTVSGWEE